MHGGPVRELAWIATACPTAPSEAVEHWTRLRGRLGRIVAALS
jgi:hypothetical protein